MIFLTPLRLGSDTGSTVRAGTGSPEGVVTAEVGSTFHRLDGGAGTMLYHKESGSGNNGWVSRADRTPKITAGTTAPGSPATGDVWFDTN
jgi:hypothetical protein